MRQPSAPMTSWTGVPGTEPPALLGLYRLAMRLCAPLVPFALKGRLARGKEDGARLGERFGIATIERPPGALVWMHGASVGEMLSVLPLIEGLAKTRPDASILLTSGTVTSARLAAERLPEGVLHQFVPLDVPAYLERFLDHWRPQLAIFAESELWPNTIMALKTRGIASTLVNGRLSERSAARWRRTPQTISWLLGSFDICLAQSRGDAERLKSLGAHHVTFTGNLKLDVPAPAADEIALASLREAIGNREVLVAASTHEGEETILAEAHRKAAAEYPSLLTIIAPRHPERGPGVAQEMARLGLKVTMRSQGRLPEADSDIYVADTLGELGLLYRLGGPVFVGGSLIPHGGQNPIEPAKLDAAILHGPHVFNFAEIYAELDEGGAAWPIASAEELAAATGELLADAGKRARMAGRARQIVEQGGGALEKTLAAIGPLLAGTGA